MIDCMISECPDINLEKEREKLRGNVPLCLDFGGKMSTILPQSINLFLKSNFSLIFFYSGRICNTSFNCKKNSLKVVLP